MTAIPKRAAASLTVPRGGKATFDARTKRAGVFRVQVTAPGDLVELGILAGGTDAQLAQVVAAAGRSDQELATALAPFLPPNGRSSVTPTARYVQLVKRTLASIRARQPVGLTVVKLRKLDVGERGRAALRGADLIEIEEVTLGRDSHVELAGPMTIVRVTRSMNLAAHAAVSSTSCTCLATFDVSGTAGVAGAVGAAGAKGTSGGAGTKASCGYFDDTCATRGGTGGVGGGGQEGGAGSRGGDASNLVLDLRALTAAPSGLCVVARGGTGGAGGRGGAGGQGGAGGLGGDGGGCEYGARGGDGGRGGRGGNGGAGGDGGDGGEVALFLSSMPACVQVSHAAGAPGAGGPPGTGGVGGSPGAAGTTSGSFSADRSCSKAPAAARVGPNGSPGDVGRPGEPGKPGVLHVLTE